MFSVLSLPEYRSALFYPYKLIITKGRFEYIPDVESLNIQAIVRPLTGMKPPVPRMKPNRPFIAQSGRNVAVQRIPAPGQADPRL